MEDAWTFRGRFMGVGWVFHEGDDELVKNDQAADEHRSIQPRDPQVHYMVMAAFSESVWEQVEDAATILSLSSSHSTLGEEVCTELLTGNEPDELAVLLITLTQPLDERLDLVTQQVEDELSTVAVIDAGATTRSTAVEDDSLTITAGPSTPSFEVAVEPVESPGNLTRLGVYATHYLDEWETREEEIVVCFHSLSTLLQYRDPDEVFRFLHTLSSHLNQVEATAHFHVDPSAHEEQTVNTFKPLFDAIIAVDQAGELTVETR